MCILPTCVLFCFDMKQQAVYYLAKWSFIRSFFIIWSLLLALLISAIYILHIKLAKYIFFILSFLMDRNCFIGFLLISVLCKHLASPVVISNCVFYLLITSFVSAFFVTTIMTNVE